MQKRFSEVHGGYLAAAITLAGFLSMFPLLLVAVGVLGFLSVNSDGLPTTIIGNLGLSGSSAALVLKTVETAERSRRTASIVGLVGLLWSGLGLIAAMQYTWDNIWQVTGRGFKDKARGIVFLVGATLIGLVSLAATAILNLFPRILPVSLIVGLAVSFGLWLWTHRALTRSAVGWRQLVPGAVVGAVGLEILKLVGAVWVPRAVAASSGLYGSIGTVFAVVAWLFVFGRLAVYATIVNVVRFEEDSGTITTEIEMPRHPGVVTVGSTRSGEAVTR